MLIDPKFMRFYALISGAVFTKLLLIFAGYWLGNKADEHFGTPPFLMFLGIVVGAGLGIWQLMRALEKTR